MKISFKMVVAICFLTVATAGGVNLFPNGDFERLGKDGHPVGYSRAPTWAGATAKVSRFEASDEAYGGKFCGKYTSDGQGGFVSGATFHLKPERWYRFSGRIKKDLDPVMESVRDRNPPPGAFVKIMPRLPSTWKGPWPKVQQPILNAGGGASDWEEYVDYFKSDSVWTNVWAGVYILDAAGTAWFDDLRVEEVDEATAREGMARKIRGSFADGENIIFNGSFEIAGNDDMPDYIFSGIGAPWFTDKWETRRFGSVDSPDGDRFLRTGSYVSDTFAMDTNRVSMLSFFARSDRPGAIVNAGLNGKWKRFTLTEKWTRYSMACPRGKGGRINIGAVRKNDVFDIDGVMLNYGDILPPYARHKDDGFFDDFRRRMEEKGAKVNAACADVAFGGPLPEPSVAKDGFIDFRFDTVFTGEGVALRGNIAESSREIVITNAAGVVRSMTFSAAELARGVVVARDLPEGMYGLVGNSWTFTVVPPKERWSRVDNFARMAFTEKGPWFPCVFSMAMTERFVHRIPEIAEAGFNTAFVWGYGTNKTDRYTAFDPAIAKKLLDGFEAAGINVISQTPVMTEERYLEMKRDKTVKRVFAWEVRDNPFDTIFAAKTDFVKTMKDHPAIRMWHHYDEVYGYWESGKYPKRESDIAATYAAARVIDPYRIHWNNSTAQNRLYGGARSTDAASATIYTISYTGDAMQTVRAGEGLAKVGEKLGGRPGMANIWLQFYSGDGEVGKFGREPSAEEMEAMMYGCAIKGVRSFCFFSMRPRSNRLWFRTGELSREMDALKNVFAFGRRRAFASSHPSIAGVAYEYEGKLYLITCNGAYYGASGKINLPEPFKNGKAEIMFENRQIDFDGWTLKDDWKPLSRHVYIISPK